MTTKRDRNLKKAVVNRQKERMKEERKDHMTACI